MTLSTTTNKATFAGSGTTGPFSFTFPFYDDDDLAVYKVVDGTPSLLTITTDYTVSGAGETTGGSVTTVDTVDAGETLVVLRDLTLSQLVDLVNGGSFYADTLEEVADRLTMFCQQLSEALDRTIKLPIGSTTDTDSLAENMLAVANVATDIGTVADNIADVNTVADNIVDVGIVADNVVDLTNFADVYQGAKAVDPATRNDSSALHAGDMYFNTTTDVMMIYTSNGWIAPASPDAVGANFDTASGDGSTTSFTLEGLVLASLDAIEVFVGGVFQRPTIDYTARASYVPALQTYSVVIAFTSAPAVGTDNISFRWYSSIAVGVPNNDSVSTIKIQNGAVTKEKLASDAIDESIINTSDVTTLDVSATKHGFCPKLPNNTTTFLRGDGSYASPDGGDAGTVDGLHAADICNYAESWVTTQVSSATSIPWDDTIPQSGEGAQLTTVSITPKSATNRLIIDVSVYCDGSATYLPVVALFKDSEAGARAVGCKYSPSGDYLTCVSFRYSMVAGGTSAITFKLRYGGAGGGTVYVNGTSGDGRRFGGVMRSGLSVTEIAD